MKEGTDSSQGIPQLVSNISACQVIAEAVRTTLGPRGMDKLIVDGRGKSAAFFRSVLQDKRLLGNTGPAQVRVRKLTAFQSFEGFLTMKWLHCMLGVEC